MKGFNNNNKNNLRTLFDFHTQMQRRWKIYTEIIYEVLIYLLHGAESFLRS